MTLLRIIAHLLLRPLISLALLGSRGFLNLEQIDGPKL
jgi:hypothetical protein